MTVLVDRKKWVLHSVYGALCDVAGTTLLNKHSSCVLKYMLRI